MAWRLLEWLTGGGGTMGYVSPVRTRPGYLEVALLVAGVRCYLLVGVDNVMLDNAMLDNSGSSVNQERGTMLTHGFIFSPMLITG